MPDERGVSTTCGDGGEGLQRHVGTFHVGRVVHVVVEAHGLFVDGGFQRVIGIRQRRQDVFTVLEPRLALLGCGGLVFLGSQQWTCCHGGKGGESEGLESFAAGDWVHKWRRGNVLHC